VGTLAATLSRPRRLVIDLPSSIELAGGRSIEIQRARIRLDEAENQTHAEYFALFPTITPLFRAMSHIGQAQPQSGINVYVTRTNFLTQPVIAATWRPGAVVFGVLTAARREDAAQAGTETARLDTVVAAAHGYFELVQGHALLDIAKGAVREAEELKRNEDSLLAKGAGLQVRVYRAEAELAARNQELAAAEGRIAVASARLAAVLQLEPDVELVPKEAYPPLLPLVRSSIPITDLIAFGLDERPEVRDLRSEKEARLKAREGAIYGPLVPFVTPLIQTGYFGPTLGKLNFSQDAMVIVGWVVGPDGLLDIPRIRGASLGVQRAQLDMDELRARIQREVSEAKARAVAAEESLEAAHDGVIAAREYLRLARDRLAKGVTIQLEVLDAQSMFLRARAREVGAIVEYDGAQYDLLRALGSVPS
jgi:outer membrane protein TolC